MNRVQKNYMITKEAFQAVNTAMNNREREFLKDKGRPEDRLLKIEDDTTFELLNEEFSALTQDMWADLVTARCAFNNAEKALVSYALSISPAGIRETLRRGCRQVIIRERLINLVMTLDTRTVPAPAGRL
jgi:hypothetical protein